MQKGQSFSNSERFYRRGRDHRGGWLTTFADVRERFGFRSLQIGQWVTKGEKETAALHFYDALCDLMDILQGPEALISLKNTLSLKYGTGGQKGVMAYYELTTKTFALAKNAGPGSIAHEWFHAFDHYISAHFLKLSNIESFASDAYWNGAEIRPHTLNEKLAVCFDAVFYKDTNANPTDFVQRSLDVDQKHRQRYFSQPCELMARAFEAFIQDSAIKNNFLAKGTRQSPDAKEGLYPMGVHRRLINNAFSAYFSSLGAALKRQVIELY